MHNNHNLDLLSIMHMQNLGSFHQFVLKILSGKENLTIIKDHNSIVNKQKLTRNNPNLDLVKINAYAKFDQIPSICSQGIELKGNSDNHQGP